MNEIFNEEQKMRYIVDKEKEVVIPNNYLKCQFGKTYSMETELGKDMCNFTTYEIIEYYKILNVSSLESLQVMNSQFSMYVQWCLQQNIVFDNQNHFLEINKEILKGCLNKVVFDRKIVTRQTLLQWCYELPNAKDILILLCLFEGIKGKDFCEIVNLRMKDFNGNKVKLCTGREVIASDELVKYAIEAYEATEYYSISGTQTKKMPLKDLGYLIKGYPNQRDDVSAFQKSRVIYNSVMRSLNFIGVFEYVSANSLSESGKIHYIISRSKELNITPKQYVYSEYIKEVEQQYDYKIVKSNYCSKYEEYLK